MDTATARTSKTLLCGALLATITTVSTVTESGYADPVDIQVDSNGVTAPLGAGGSYMSGLHTFNGASTTIFAPFGAGSTYYIVVTSAFSTGGWDYEVSVDYAPFSAAFGFPGGSIVLDLGIKEETTLSPITGFTVSAGGAPLTLSSSGSTAGSIHIEFSVLNLTANGTGDQVVTVQWTQQAIPTPGALALLGVAGALVGSRRRRRS